MESDLQKQACRVYGNASIEPVWIVVDMLRLGGRRIKDSMEKSILTHKKEQYSARNRPLCFKIESLTFGNTSQHTVSSSLQGYEGEGCFLVKNNDVNRAKHGDQSESV